jgi:hypothetical protein
LSPEADTGAGTAPAAAWEAGIAGERRRWLRDGLQATLPAWVAGHALVIGLSWYFKPSRPLGRLFLWDTEWYLVIARHGYDAAGGLVHFFPLTPVVAGALAAFTRLPVTIALFGFCWAMALLFGALVHAAVVRETGDRAAAARAAWLTQLAPGAYALVMGYTEPLAGVLAAGHFLALRGVRDGDVKGGGARGSPASRSGARPWLAALLGFFGGMSRPVGVLLAVPGAVEGVRSARREGWSRAAVVKGAAAALAPVAGLAAFLGYSRLEFGGWLLPYTQQTSKLGRGGIMSDPFRMVPHVWTHNWRNHGHGIAIWACVLIVFFAALVVVVARRLPVSYLAWTAPSFLLAIGSKDFTSLPRYLGALFPCLIAAALVSRRRWQWAALLAVCCALTLWTTYFVFAEYEVA